MCDVIVATGEMFHEWLDFYAPGQPPFEFKRSYSSTANTVSTLGPGWQHNWHIELAMSADAFTITTGNDPVPIPRDRCDGKHGPFVRIEEAAGIAELRFPDQQRDVFQRTAATGGKWLLVERTDPYGNWLKCRYSDGRLAEITDVEGRNVRFEYNVFGLLEAFQFLHGRSRAGMKFRYDAGKRLAEVIDPLGRAERFEYDHHLIVRHVDRGGLQRWFQYDQLERCVRNWFDQGYVHRKIDFAPDNSRVVVANSLGWRVVYRRMPNGMLESAIDPLGRKTQWLYDDTGEQICELLPDGSPYQTALVDPATGTLTNTDFAGAATVFVKDAAGNTTSITNGCGAVVRFRFNEQGRIVETIDPIGGRWLHDFDSRGRLAKLTDPKGEWVRVTYRQGETLVEDMVGVWAKNYFDELGNLLRREDAFGRKLAFTYDGFDGLRQIIERDGGTTTFELGPLGEPLLVIDPIGRRTEYKYNALHSLREIGYADATKLAYDIDREGNVTRLTNQKGESTSFELDAAQRLVAVQFFDGMKRTFEYDDCDRVTAVSDPRGRVAYRHEASQSPTEIEWPDGSKQTNTYDPMRKLVAMQWEPPPGSDADPHETSFAYDLRDKVIAETNDGFTAQYHADASGYLAGITDSQKRQVKYDLNPRGLVTGLTDNGSRYEFEFNACNEMERIGLPNGMSMRLQFDVCSRLTRREVVSRTGSVLSWRDFRYDAADQMIGMSDWRLGKFDYLYDPIGRLTHVLDGTGATVERYEFDPCGNLLSSPLYRSFVYDPGHRLRQTDQVRYEHDPGGRLVRTDDGATRWDFEYDFGDQLARASSNGATVAEYGYDLCGRRTWKRTATDKSRYYYHVNKLATIDSTRDGRWDVVHVPDTFAPLAMHHDGRRYFFAFDQGGTPVEIWDDDERLVATITAQAFGANRRINWLTATQIPMPFHFQGQFCDDETGLHYNRFRYYQPTTGRFTAQDPIVFAGGFNLYLYPPNPTTWIDPLGLIAPLALACGTAERNFTPCEAKAAMAKLKQINKGSTYKCKKNSECRKGNQKGYYDKNCKGIASADGLDVDHLKELQVGGGDHCCSNLCAIPASANRSLGSQIKNAISGFGEGDALPKFTLGAPCSASYTKSCKQNYGPSKPIDPALDECKPTKPKDC